MIYQLSIQLVYKVIYFIFTQESYSRLIASKIQGEKMQYIKILINYFRVNIHLDL